MLYIYNLDVSIYIGLKCVLNYIYIYRERERDIAREKRWLYAYICENFRKVS